MGIGKRILNVLIGLLFIISVTVLGSSFLAKKVLVDAISQAGVDTALLPNRNFMFYRSFQSRILA
mgnify:CR=1 FL=1